MTSHEYEEVPEAIAPLSKEELLVAARLSKADLEIIDANVLANSSKRWLKVARVVTYTEDALRGQYPGLSYVFYTHRLCELVERARLEVKGDPFYIRFSEVRLPND
jgi:hypothetical protein